MSMFDKVKSAFGGVGHQLLTNGLLARGNIRAVAPTAMSVRRPEQGLGTRVVCTVTVEVVPLDGSQPPE